MSNDLEKTIERIRRTPVGKHVDLEETEKVYRTFYRGVNGEALLANCLAEFGYIRGVQAERARKARRTGVRA